MRIRLHFFKRVQFYRDLFLFKRQAKSSLEPFPLGKLFPCIHEKGTNAGEASGHYFHQDLLVARKVFEHNPKKHVDIGSRVDGFIAHLASFRETEVLDVRPLENNIPNVIFKQADLMSQEFNLVDYCDSVSSLHAVEHFGLGRYGDKLDFEGHLKGLDNMYKMLRPRGKFYFSVPIGPQRVEFNGHRVFSIRYLLSLFHNKYAIDSFSYISNGGELNCNAPLTSENIQNNFSCTYGCGIFEMTKL